MSVINQVLTELEKRGADELPTGYAIRVVHLPENRRKAALLMGGVLILVCLAGWLGWYWQHKAAVPESAALAPAKLISAPKFAPQPPAISQSITTVAPEAAQKESVHKAEALIADINSESHITPKPSISKAKLHAAEGGHSQHKDMKTHPVAQRSMSVPAGNSEGQAGAHEQTEHAAEGNALANAPVIALGGKLDKRTRQASVQQQADNEFRKANGLMQQGHIDEALAGYEAALRLDAGHDAARQAMVALLLENKRNDDAERVLKDGLRNNLKNSGFAMVLARLQVEREASWSALLTLQKTLPYASQQADYQAFIAALLQRLNRHKEAVVHYQKALQLSPNSGVWLMGQGISLQALQRKEDARDAFKRAIETHALSEDLQAFVAQRLKEL